MQIKNKIDFKSIFDNNNNKIKSGSFKIALKKPN